MLINGIEKLKVNESSIEEDVSFDKDVVELKKQLSILNPKVAVLKKRKNPRRFD